MILRDPRVGDGADCVSVEAKEAGRLCSGGIMARHVPSDLDKRTKAGRNNSG